jgi:hypothetical protein
MCDGCMACYEEPEEEYDLDEEDEYEYDPDEEDEYEGDEIDD